MSSSVIRGWLRSVERMQSIMPPPPELDDRRRRSADAALDGVVLVQYLGEHPLALGRRRIDWLRRDDQRGAAVARFGFLEDLAVVYHLTGDVRYAAAARDYLEDFMRAFPSEHLGRRALYNSVLDLGIRNTTWLTALGMLVSSPAFDVPFVERLVTFIGAQLQYLREHLSTTINWRVSNARDLLLGGLYLDYLEPSSDWRRYAVSVLNDAWFRQFLPDGVHCECIPSYHANVAESYLLLYRIGCRMPELGLVMTLNRLREIFDFTLACRKPNGYLCGLHDSQTEFAGDIEDDLVSAWDRGQRPYRWERFRSECGLSLDRPPISQTYPDAGLAFMRTGWDADATWLSFDATRWGGGHCHLSRNSVQLHAHRRSMVIDPGWPYYGEPEWGEYGASTRAHSTCNLNGFSQSPTNPSRFETHFAPGYDAVFSVYEGGYWDIKRNWDFTSAANGIWAQHARLLFWVHDRFAFVADSMLRLPLRPDDPAGERPSFECVWQLAPDATVDVQPDRNRITAHWRDAGLLVLTPIRPDNSRYDVHRGSMNPLRGWVPEPRKRWEPDIKNQRPAPQLVIRTPRMHQQHDYCVSIMVPFRGREAPEVKVDARSPMGKTGYVRLAWGDGTADEIHWGCNFGVMLGSQGGFETDSSLVHLLMRADGRVLEGCCVHGTYLKPYDPRIRPYPETFPLGRC